MGPMLQNPSTADLQCAFGPYCFLAWTLLDLEINENIKDENLVFWVKSNQVKIFGPQGSLIFLKPNFGFKSYKKKIDIKKNLSP